MVHICWENKNFDKKKAIHFWGLNALNMQKHFLFVSSFEHINFAINEKIPKALMTIQTTMFIFWFSKHKKI
jgi:hypothetical protein